MFHKYFLISWLCLWFGASLLPSNAVEDFVKLPFLFAHYQHKHTDISFLEFLRIHYTQEISHDQEHENLPLHGHQHHNLQNVNIFLPQNPFVFSLQNIFLVIFSPQKTIIWANNYSFKAFSCLFHPPK